MRRGSQQFRKQRSTQAGFIRWILIIIVIIILLSYFGVDLRGTVENEQTQSNFSFVFEWLEKIWNFVVNVWSTYIEEPATYIWDFIRVHIWERWLVPLFDTIENTEPSDVLADT